MKNNINIQVIKKIGKLNLHNLAHTEMAKREMSPVKDTGLCCCHCTCHYSRATDSYDVTNGAGSSLDNMEVNSEVLSLPFKFVL